jgi:hypothetical protein
MKDKFTFKSNPKFTGLQRIGAGTPDVQIKYKGKRCGFISFNDSAFSKTKGISISLHQKKEPSKDDPASFSCVRYKQRFDSLDAAKKCLQFNISNLLPEIYFIDD